MSIGTPLEENPLKTIPSQGNAGILVVDEDPAFQLGLKTFLRDYVGFDEVYVANSGAEALELIETEETIEVVTLDFQMPEMNGIEVMEALREREIRPLSVIMITGYPSEDLESEFLSYDSDILLAKHFLSKPVEFERLEPLLLRAHEELLVAREAALAEEPEELSAANALGVVTDETLSDSERLQRLDESFARQERKLIQIQDELQEVKTQQRRDFFLLVLVGLVIWAVAHFSLGDEIDLGWEKLKTDLSEIFTFGSRESDSADPAPAAKTETEASSTESEVPPGDASEPTLPQEDESLNEGTPL
ncbi:MAG: response regulator [Verrucomicrobiota bacterium]